MGNQVITGHRQRRSLVSSKGNSDDLASSDTVDFASIFKSNLSLRSAGTSIRSLIHIPGTGAFGRTCRARASITKDAQTYSNSKTVWPVTFCELPFLPEFPVRGEVNQSTFDVLEVISSGAYGKVFKVTHKQSGKTYAMKSISKSKIFKDNAVNQIKDEIRIHKMCGHHPFLINCPFHWQSRKTLFLVTEYISGGDLHQIWKETGYFEEDLIKIYLAELAVVIDFLHNAGIIYRDMKMENVLIDIQGHLKLIDFGLSKWLSIGNRTNTICGTPIYMAPEVLRQESYTHAIDWWSLGVLLFALLQGKFPFRKLTEEVSELEFTDPVPSEPACRLVRSLLNRDHRQRLRSLRTLQNHAFYHHFDFEAIRSKQVDPRSLLEQQRSKSRSFPLEWSASDAIASFD